MSHVEHKKSWMPTRKWFTAVVTALTGWAVAFINVDGHWTKTIIIGLVTIVSQALLTYAVPNLGTPGGVPVKVRRRRRRAASK